MKIVLVGYMGSGKSVVGSSLAAILGVKFLDLDSEIEKEEGMTIAQIFDKKGEIYFRQKERETLLMLIEQDETTIIATGGGTPCYGDLMQVLADNKEATTIYLKSSLETLTARLILEKDKRPLISHLKTEELLHDFIRKHLFERNFYYFQAEKSVVVNDKTVEAIVAEIVVDLF